MRIPTRRAETPTRSSATTSEGGWDLLRLAAISVAAVCILLLSAPDNARAEAIAPLPPPPSEAGAIKDQRFDPTDRVVGLVIAGEPRAYAVSELPSDGAPIHDLVSGNRLDVGIEQDQPRVAPATLPVSEKNVTTWARWSIAHPDTSIWHPSATPEGEATRSAGDVSVKDVHHYRADLAHPFVQSVAGGEMESAMLVVIAGSVTNMAATPVHHVVLKLELVDKDGKVVYRDESYNHRAEALADAKLDDPGRVTPIEPGATDTFRMILMSGELPAFQDTRVTVARIY